MYVFIRFIGLPFSAIKFPISVFSNHFVVVCGISTQLIKPNRILLVSCCKIHFTWQFISFVSQRITASPILHHICLRSVGYHCYYPLNGYRRKFLSSYLNSHWLTWILWVCNAR